MLKFCGCLLAVGAGLPVGPEAPMIHLGAMVGRGTAMMKSSTFGVSAGLSSASSATGGTRATS